MLLLVTAFLENSKIYQAEFYKMNFIKFKNL